MYYLQLQLWQHAIDICHKKSLNHGAQPAVDLYDPMNPLMSKILADINSSQTGKMMKMDLFFSMFFLWLGMVQGEVT